MHSDSPSPLFPSNHARRVSLANYIQGGLSELMRPARDTRLDPWLTFAVRTAYKGLYCCLTDVEHTPMSVMPFVVVFACSIAAMAYFYSRTYVILKKKEEGERLCLIMPREAET
jgi:hypothetical protein